MSEYMHHTETAQIIQFSALRPKPGKSALRRRGDQSSFAGSLLSNKENNPQCEENVSTTGKNSRLRKQRHESWREADALREYWRASMKMVNAIASVQRNNLPEGDLHPQYKPEDHRTALAKYRAAIMNQLLTPASTAAEVTWKRAAFKAGDHRYTDVKAERIERAIADDVEFLKAHPMRRS